MTSTAEKPDYRAYGNFLEHRSPGVFGAGLVATSLLMGGLVFALMALIVVGPVVGITFAALGAVAFLFTGTPLGSGITRRVGWANQRRNAHHQWRSGMSSRTGRPEVRLPGLLGRTRLLAAYDAFGEPFAVVFNPVRGGTWTIVARCVAEGPWLQDQERVDAWVGRYSRVLATCGHDSAIVSAKAITDTAPDPGGRLAAMVASMRPESGTPSLARQVIDEAVADYPSASSENVTYFEITYRGRGLDRKAKEATILTELARRVPGLMGQLASGGGGSVSMVGAHELPTIVRVAYDPAAAPFLESAELSSNGDPAYRVGWNEAGPVAGQEAWDHYTHDSGHSVTWEMVAAPRSAVTERALIGLLAPHHDFTRKRVALIYRPHSPDEAASVSENDANSALFVANQSKKRVTASATLRVRATEQARQEVAAGAGLMRWHLMVTGTVRDLEDLEQAASTIEGRAGAVPLRLRRCYGSQAAAFAATLPVGFIPWEHTMIPDKIRQWL